MNVNVLNIRLAVRTMLILLIVLVAVLFFQTRRASVSVPPRDERDAAGLRDEQKMSSSSDVRAVFTADAWNVFAKGDTNGNADSSQGDDHLRYVGWFFMLSSPDSDARDANRSGIVEDVQENRQYFVREGDTFTTYEVLQIFQDRMILRRDGEEIELRLSSLGGLSILKANSGGGPTLSENNESGETILESNRFGKRVGDNRWIIQKQALVDYYHELLEDPERIAAIYATHKPDYNEAREITGYQIQIEGEKDFFDAIGIREGDRIRKVNSMNMTSQSRAEYFIAEFMRDRLGAVVMDVERDGEMQKMIYLLE